MAWPHYDDINTNETDKNINNNIYDNIYDNIVYYRNDNENYHDTNDNNNTGNSDDINYIIINRLFAQGMRSDVRSALFN